MAHRLQKLEHEGGQLFTNELIPNRRQVRRDKIKAIIKKAQKSKTLEEKQIEYLSPANPALWDGDEDD